MTSGTPAIEPSFGPTPPRRRRLLFIILASAVAIGATAFVLLARPRKRYACGPETPHPESSFVACDTLAGGEVLATALQQWCLPAGRIDQTYAALAATDFDFRNMRSGDIIQFKYKGLDLAEVTYRRDPVILYHVLYDSVGACASKETKQVDTVRAVVRGTVKGSLWNSITGMGETPALVVEFAGVLSYEVDFLTECSEGDSFEILMDKLMVDSQFYRDGRIYSVHYRGIIGDYSGFFYRSPSGHWDYYNAKGQSLRKSVLRSPLTFANVTSRFGMRLHPISRVYRQHEGVDYGAPTGTPVSAIADGTITRACWNGGYGRLVEVRHSGGLMSRYGHLSRYGSGVKSGRRVHQGQTVGYVGSTGYSTGPHLHFEVRQGGRSVNPLKVIPPRAEPVPKKYMPDFERLRNSYTADLKHPAGLILPAADSTAG